MEVWIISNFFLTVDKTIVNNSIYILIHTYGINTYKLNYWDVGYMYVKSLNWVWLFVTPWTVAHQVPWSMGFSRHEYWSGLPFPSPGDLPDSGIKPRSPALHADTLPPELQGKPHNITLRPSFFFFWPGGKNTGMNCHSLLHEIFPTQGLNRCLPHCRQTLYHLSHQGSHTYMYVYIFVNFN